MPPSLWNVKRGVLRKMIDLAPTLVKPPVRVSPPMHATRRQEMVARTLLAATLLGGWSSALGQAPAAQPTFYEFGTVVTILRSGIEVQAYDEPHHRYVRHTFQLASDTRADVVRTGDAVEMIYTVDESGFVVRRMVLLEGGLPKAGPPATSTATPSPDALPPAVTAAKRTDAKNRVVPSVSKAPVIAVPAAKAVAQPKPVDLSGKTIAKTPPITSVPLGIAGGYSKAAPVPTTRAVSRDTPSEECNRSSADWPNEPLRIAVLDFRYPTEREEAHDIGKTGGGSGTAVADLVFTRLDNLHVYQMVRGDRRRLDRSDIAGAAKLGRELGADAVLEGTFAPIDAVTGPDGTELKPRSYELRAGLVDTCTGQVLMKMSSAACSAGADQNGASCPHFAVSAREAEEPDQHAHAFDPAIRALVFPLEHNDTPTTVPGAIGSVVDVEKDSMTIHMTQGTARIGDQFAIHAQRLTKNPGTYTLQNLQDQEIGRFIVRRVQGATLFGDYTGDVPARVGDVLEQVPPQ